MVCLTRGIFVRFSQSKMNFDIRIAFLGGIHVCKLFLSQYSVQEDKNIWGRRLRNTDIAACRVVQQQKHRSRRASKLAACHHSGIFSRLMIAFALPGSDLL